MTWFAIYDPSTGRLVSLATVLAGDLDKQGLATKDLGETRPPDDQMWNELARSFIPRPPKVVVDRVQDLLTDPLYLDFQLATAKLLASDRDAVTGDVGDLLGRERFRSAGEAKAIAASAARIP